MTLPPRMIQRTETRIQARNSPRLTFNGVISPAPTQAQQCCYVITTVAADQSLPSSQCSAAAAGCYFPAGTPAGQAVIVDVSCPGESPPAGAFSLAISVQPRHQSLER